MPPGSMAEPLSRFFKVILANTIEENKLSIPPAFLEKFGDELSGVTTLTVPDGYSWHIGITRDEGKVWFHNGWHEFLNYYSICVGYFLLFQYRKNSNFQVHIIDTSSCEIQYPRRNICTPSSQSSPCPSRSNNNMSSKNSSNFKKGCDDEMGGNQSRMKEVVDVKDELDTTVVIDSTQHKLSKTEKMSNSKGSVRRKIHLSETPSRLFVQETADLSIDDTKMKKAKHNVKKKKKKKKKTVQGADGNKFIAFLEDLGINMSNSRISLSLKERQTAINAAKFFKPENPSFLVIMRDSFIQKRSVYVPVAFSRKYLRRDKSFSVQDCSGTKLPVAVSCSGNDCFLTGWTGFFMQNDLKAGDILFFELIKIKKLLLKVSVFHMHNNKYPECSSTTHYAGSDV